MKRWQRVADAHPDREAVVTPDGPLSYAELPRASQRITVGLLRQGQSGNSIGTILARYGLLKAWLVPVCTLPAHRDHEIEANCAARRYSVGRPISELDDLVVLAPGTETALQ
ncbi:hypothetical protein GCM10017744_008670 [Streptomyces antimycoticus]|uniref:Uncharacterized protein n=1 Tax=Streptomyces antimycoticus TaxID=68175 RepID=A0A4D4KH26_9ACTN|nr:(2,3-dihydroxybenzoyl)adenylate synthase [Streptomyces antimycoticus]GDY48265.1 hypothetical protein SANT12839_091470 [Streptomyces antimycoticus]